MYDDVLRVFLEMFDSVRSICDPCLVRMTDLGPRDVAAWLDSKVAEGTVTRVLGACLNCEETMTVYALTPAT